MWPFNQQEGSFHEHDPILERSEMGYLGQQQSTGVFRSFSNSTQETPSPRRFFSGVPSLESLQERFGSTRNQNGESSGYDGSSIDGLASYFCGEMSYENRVYGFVTCFLLGMFLSFSSTFMIIRPVKFAIPYTFGSILSLGSSMFFVGPQRFCRTMFGETRRTASILYLLMLFITVFVAVYWKSSILSILCIGLQFASYAWLMASYIPFGRPILSSTCKGFISFFY